MGSKCKYTMSRKSNKSNKDNKKNTIQSSRTENKI